jgi:O-antigen/teichoic acid export membrane protein
VALAVVLLLRRPILDLIGGQEATDAAPVLAAGAAAFAINGAVFWNVGVLFAAGRAQTVSRIAVITALTQAALLIPLVVALDAPGAAISFLASIALSNLAATVIALRVVEPNGDNIAAIPESLADTPEGRAAASGVASVDGPNETYS